MLKSTITVLFVITIVAFSLVSANIFAASSNMNTAAYAAKKGHSSSSGDTSSSGGKSSSKSEKSGSSGGSSTKSKGDDTGSSSTSDSDKDRDSVSKDTDVGRRSDTGGIPLGTPPPGTNEPTLSPHHKSTSEPLQQGPAPPLPPGTPRPEIECVVPPCTPVPPPPPNPTPPSLDCKKNLVILLVLQVHHLKQHVQTVQNQLMGNVLVLHHQLHQNVIQLKKNVVQTVQNQWMERNANQLAIQLHVLFHR
jgi:hypothetical protein